MPKRASWHMRSLWLGFHLFLNYFLDKLTFETDRICFMTTTLYSLVSSQETNEFILRCRWDSSLTPLLNDNKLFIGLTRTYVEYLRF